MKSIWTLVLVFGACIGAGAQETPRASALDGVLEAKVLAARQTCPRDAVLESVGAYARECDLTFRLRAERAGVAPVDTARAFLSYIYKEGGDAARFADSAACARKREVLVRTLKEEPKKERSSLSDTVSSAKAALKQKLRDYFKVTPEAFDNCRNSHLGRRAGISDQNQEVRRYNMPR